MLNLIKNSSISKLTIWFLLLIMLFAFFNLKRWNHAETKQKIIMQDITWYYCYLPAVFIHHDISLDFIKTKSDQIYVENHQYWYQIAPNGGKVNKFTMGLAILYSPFFIVAHLTAPMFGYDANGFSKPYEFLLALSSLFYLFLGLIYLRKLILLFYSETITSITLICVLLGTNLFYYATTEPAMSHAYTFSLVAIFLYHFIKFYNTPNVKKAFLIGFLFGLIVLIRPVNIILVIIPLLYNIYSKQTLINKINYFIQHRKLLLIIATTAFLVFLPQLIYWKCITGNWFFYSYMNEKFFFNNPHVWLGLFGFRKGWLIYTPIMFFALFGIISLYKKQKQLFFPVLFFFFINIYVIFSWWTWWYGGSFSSRPMIDFYALMAIPMATFFNFILTKSKIIITALLVLLTLLISLNQFQTLQKRKGIIHWDAMSWAAYKLVFFKTDLTQEDIMDYDKLLIRPDYDKAKIGEDE